MAKLKCAQYWPKEEETFATFGNVSVKVLECQKMPSFELRKLSVHCQVGWVENVLNPMFFSCH